MCWTLPPLAYQKVCANTYASVQAADLTAVPSTVVLGGISILTQTGHKNPP